MSPFEINQIRRTSLYSFDVRAHLPSIWPRRLERAFYGVQRCTNVGVDTRISMKGLPQQNYRPSRGSRIIRFFNRNSTLLSVTICICLIVFIVFDPRRNQNSLSSSESTETESEDLLDAPDVSTGAVGQGRAKIGKLSMLYGTPGEIYERAIRGHEPHNERFGYPFYVLHEKTLPGYWSKPGFILQHLLTELSKPEDERLEWLVWFDADTVLMNPKIPLEIFLPPAQDWSHVHAVVTNDHRGLNNGVFFLRVHEWSVWLMNACLGTETFDPRLHLDFGDQSALMYWLNQDRFRSNTIHVPQRWFNAYTGFRGETTNEFSDPTQPQTKFRKNSIREGDLLVHHAGHKSLRAQRMKPWLDLAEEHSATWELELEKTTYLKEIEQFWLKVAPNERRTMDKLNQKLAEIKAVRQDHQAKKRNV